MNTYSFTSNNTTAKVAGFWEAKCQLSLFVNGLHREFTIIREAPIPKYYWMSLFDLLINRVSNDMIYGRSYKSMCQSILYDKPVCIEGEYSDYTCNLFCLEPNNIEFIDKNIMPIVEFIETCLLKQPTSEKADNEFYEKYLIWNESN